MTDTIYNTPDFGFEELIARHCGPALAGIKPANLVSVSKAKIDNIDEKMTALNAKLNRKDIYLETICECDKTAVIRRYKCCRCAILKRIAQGKTLAQIFAA